jgi:hypothetical protein
MEGKTMKAAIALLVSALGQMLYILLLLGAALGLLVGIILLIDSQRVLRWNAYLDRWISTGNATRVLDQPRDVKRIVYRRHRIVGLVVLAAALYALDVLVFSILTRPLVHIFRDLANPGALQVFTEGVRLFLVAGNVLGILAGIILVFRPSLFKGVEGWADREYAARLSDQDLDAPRYQPDEWVRAHPRVAGVLAAGGGLFVLLSLGVGRLL